MEPRRKTAPRGRRLALGIALLAALGGGCREDESLHEPNGLDRCSVRVRGDYYLGVALSGTSETAKGVQRAVILALSEVNAAGGVHGRPVGLIECDTQLDDAEAVARMTELGHVQSLPAVIGMGISSTTVAAAPVAAAAEKVLLSPAATSPLLTSLEDHGYLFRTVISDSLQGRTLAWIAQEQGYDRVFVIHRNGPWGIGLRDVFSVEMAGIGGQVASLGYDDTSFDASVLAAQAQVWGADAILLAALVNHGAAVVNAVNNLGWQTHWLLPDGMRDPNLFTKLTNPDQLEGARGTRPATAVGVAYESFAQRYTDAWGSAPLTFDANGYDAAWLLLLAMEMAAEPTDGSRVRDNLALTTGGPPVTAPDWGAARTLLEDRGGGPVDYQGASGPVDFDGNGDVLGNVEEWGIENRDFVTLGCWTPAWTACGEE